MVEKKDTQQDGVGTNPTDPSSDPNATADAGLGSAPAEEGIPEWLDTNKYGTDVPKAIREQARAYKEAEKKMNEATEKAARMERDLELIRTSVTPQPPYPPQQPMGGYNPNVPGQSPDDFLMEQYDMSPKQLRAFYDITAINMRPVLETVSSIRADTVKEVLRKDKTFTPECERTFDDLLSKVPVQVRLNPENVKDCYMRAKAVHIDTLIAQAREEGKQLASAQPSTPQPISAPGTPRNANIGTPASPKLSDVERRNFELWGINPDEVL